MMRSTNKERGSIYVLTLLTVGAVGSMVVIGVSLRTSTSAESTITEQINRNNDGVATAAELALAQIKSDADWSTNAQKGVVFSDFTLGNRTYSSTVVDTDTLATPTADTTNYRVTVTSQHGIASESARFDIEGNKIDYQTYLESLGVDAYWPMDEASKKNKADEEIDDRDGDYPGENIAGMGTNDEGGVVPVFANASDHLETPYDDAYVDDSEGTISFWIRRTGTNVYASYGVFGQIFEPSGRPSFSMICLNGALFVYLDDSGGYDYDHMTYTDVNVTSLNTWHHIAVTWKTTDGVDIFVDGSRVVSNSSATDHWDTLDGSDGEQPFLIGAGYVLGYFSSPLAGFEGSIARFAILTNKLNDAQIAELAATKPDGLEMSIADGSWVPVFE